VQLFKDAKEADVNNEFSGSLLNVKEFISEAFTNVEFQKFLARKISTTGRSVLGEERAYRAKLKREGVGTRAAENTINERRKSASLINTMWGDFVKIVEKLAGMKDMTYSIMNDVVALAPELFAGPNKTEQSESPGERLNKKISQKEVNEFNKNQKTPEKIKREQADKKKTKEQIRLDEQFPDRIGFGEESKLRLGYFGTLLTKLDNNVFSFDAALNGEIIDSMKKGLKNKANAFGVFGQDTWNDISETFLRIASSQALHARGVGTAALEYGRPIYNQVGSFFSSEADGDANRPSFQKVMRSLRAFAKEQGISSKSAREMAHNAFVALRAFGIREKNKAVEQEYLNLQRQRKNKQATNYYKDNFIPIDLTDEQIDNGVEIFNKFPGLQEIHKNWIDAKNDIIDLQVEHELMDREMADEFKQVIDVEGIEAFDDYVNFYRDGQPLPGSYTRQQGDRGKYFKIRGSFVPVSDVFDNMSAWIQDGVTRSVLNRAAINKVEAAFEHLPGDIKEVGKVTGETPNTVSFSRLNKDGTRVIKNYQFSNPYFATAFGAGIESMNGAALQMARNTSSFLRTNVVLNPLFSLSQLIIQDVGSAMVNSGVKYPLMIPLRVAKEFPLTLINMSKTHNEMRRAGLTGSYDSFKQGESLSDQQVREEKSIYAKMTKAIDSVPGLGKGVTFDQVNPETPVSIKRFLNRIAMASDNAVRQAVYEQTMSETNNRGLAMSRGAEIINFKRSGSNAFVNVLRQVVPFFGAFLQAAAIQGRIVTGKGVSAEQRAFATTKFLTTGAQLSALSLIYTLMAQDDEEYNKLDPKIKDRRIILGNGFHLTLRPDIYTFLFKIMPEQTLNNMLGTTDNQKVADALKRALKESFLSNRFTPQIIRVPQDILNNMDVRGERPIETPRDKALKPGERYSAGTTETAKFLSQYVNLDELGISPKMIDAFIRQFFGLTGGQLMLWTDSMIENAQVLKYADASKNERDKLASVPGLSNFLSKTYGNRFTTDFFELKKEVDRAVTEYNFLRDNDYDQEKVDKVYEDNKVFIDAASEIEAYMGIIESIRKERNTILRTTREPIGITPGKQITGKDKQKMLEVLAQQEQDTLEGILEIRQRIYGTKENEEVKQFLSNLGFFKLDEETGDIIVDKKGVDESGFPKKD
jgi:hypothetical protein